jgi:hypothetical protein
MTDVGGCPGGMRRDGDQTVRLNVEMKLGRQLAASEMTCSLAPNLADGVVVVEAAKHSSTTPFVHEKLGGKSEEASWGFKGEGRGGRRAFHWTACSLKAAAGLSASGHWGDERTAVGASRGKWV